MLPSLPTMLVHSLVDKVPCPLNKVCGKQRTVLFLNWTLVLL